MRRRLASITRPRTPATVETGNELECGSASGSAADQQSGPELVSAAPLAIETLVELDLRDRPGRVQVDPLAPRAPDAAPPAHKRQILEERRFDRQDIKSRPVLGALDPFQHEKLKKGRIVRIQGHGTKLRRNIRLRPTNDRNRLHPFDSDFESIANRSEL